jgi:carboxyl-terminal processing protease
VEFLNESQRRQVFTNVLETVDKKFAPVSGTVPDVGVLRTEHETDVLGASGPDDFERALNSMLQKLRTSHTGFFHEGRPRAAGRIAIAATFTKAHTKDGVRWVFQDVHPGGAAARAGIRPGDILLSVGDKELSPPEGTGFTLGQSYTLQVRRTDGSTARPTIDVPSSGEKKRPIVVPEHVVTASKVDQDIGLIRVSMFPGILGMDVARDITRAVKELECSRLVFDLRGNTGGGIGCLRLMSHLCPDRRGTGFSVGAALMRRGYQKERLPRFDRIPSSKLGVIPLIFRFAGRGRSVAVFSEGLGTQKHHGQTAILVNEHSASAAEMVAAFASEYRLATLVGVKTAGRLVAASSFKVGFGYRVALPVAAYFTWHGTNLEGVGVTPNIEEPLSTEALWRGKDNQLERAVACLKSAAVAN